MQTETALLFNIPQDRDPPTEIRLFGPGMTETNKGQFLFDEEAARLVMARFEDSGVDRLPFDAGHEMVKPTGPDSHKALGWFVPVVKDDIEGGGGLGLFATDIEWTRKGGTAIAEREFRFYSPAITFEPESRRITGLINCALTNIPATKGQKPLVLSDDGETETKEPQMQVLLDTLGASDEKSAVAKVGEFQSHETAILSALGAESHADALEKIKMNQETAAKAVAELATLSAERAAEKRSVAVDKLIDEKKLLPAHKEFAASLSDEQFGAYVETLSVIPALTKKIEAPSEGSPKDSKVDGADFNADEYL